MSIPNIENAARSEITVQGIALSVPAPFVEGHVLRPNEAAVLNQTYAENVRNNFASSVVAALLETAKTAGIVNADTTELTPDQKAQAMQLLTVADVQSKLDEYLKTYDFGVRRSGGGTRVADPVEREALVIAREEVRKALKNKGVKVSEVDKAIIEKHALAAIEKYPKIRETARIRVEARKAVGDDMLAAIAE
jgi:hypothetical protein